MPRFFQPIPTLNAASRQKEPDPSELNLEELLTLGRSISELSLECHRSQFLLSNVSMHH